MNNFCFFPVFTYFSRSLHYFLPVLMSMSQVLVYFGKEGPLSKTPFMNLTTEGWLPAGVLSGKKLTADNALRAVFKQLYLWQAKHDKSGLSLKSPIEFQ